MEKRRIYLFRTEGEWKEINKRINARERFTINGYLVSQISKLKTKYEECPVCVTAAEGTLIEKQFYVDAEAYAMLKSLSHKMRRPISTIISDFYIAPLLSPE